MLSRIATATSSRGSEWMNLIWNCRSSRTGNTWPWCWTASSCGSSRWPCSWGRRASSCRRPRSTTRGSRSTSGSPRSDWPPPVPWPASTRRPNVAVRWSRKGRKEGREGGRKEGRSASSDWRTQGKEHAATDRMLCSGAANKWRSCSSESEPLAGRLIETLRKEAATYPHARDFCHSLLVHFSISKVFMFRCSAYLERNRKPRRQTVSHSKYMRIGESSGMICMGGHSSRCWREIAPVLS